MDTHNSLLHKTNSRKRSVIFYILFKPEFKYLYMRSMHYIIWMLVPNSSLIWKQDSKVSKKFDESSALEELELTG